MVKTQRVVVAGLGEVGKPIFELASRHHQAVGVDISTPAEKIDQVDVLARLLSLRNQGFPR